MSLIRSSLVMISRSCTGSIRSSTCVMSGSSKVRHTWKIPSTAAMCDKKALPRPSPSAAPRTKPAMSTTSKNAGTWAGKGAGLGLRGAPD